MTKHSYIRLFILFVSAFIIMQPVYAQNNEAVTAETEKEEKPITVSRSSRKMADKIPSLFFTYWQHKTIQDAKNSRGAVRPPSSRELDLDSDEFQPDPGPRELKLDGILYKAADNWTIWVNGERISPDAVPKEIMDLRVFNDHVELKWLDAFTNSVYPIRLRVHQRFNLDMRIFLPG